MKYMIVALVAGLISVSAIAGERLSSYEVEQCVEWADQVANHQRVIDRHESRINRAEQVIRSFGCYQYGNRWECPNYLSPQQEFDVDRTINARNRSVQIASRNAREGQRVVDRYNDQCVNSTFTTEDRKDACRFKDGNHFCDDAE